MSESPSARTRAVEGNERGRSAGAEESRRQRAEFKKGILLSIGAIVWVACSFDDRCLCRRVSAKEQMGRLRG
jgi:hypothetical protein